MKDYNLGYHHIYFFLKLSIEVGCLDVHLMEIEEIGELGHKLMVDRDRLQPMKKGTLGDFGFGGLARSKEGMSDICENPRGLTNTSRPTRTKGR